ncbi:hypothetical protein [Kineococcus indalonis]|uniref:hypothetical protein n=1 Tax=Kineococcus indalonis TaxID=2696566 RepID=UPI0014131135|nr:hypothetical protein [Kineococcus indalonis]NAZ84630.1 hypothetical protein [Kineococcus indalonis]
MCALTLAATTTAILAGCGPATSTTAPAVAATESSATSPTVGSAQAGPGSAPTTVGESAMAHVDYCAGQTTPFTGEAADVFGADNVMTAYCDMVTMTLDDSTFVNSLLPYEPNRQVADFSFVKKYMTATLAESWDTAVAQALGGDKDAIATVSTLTFYNVRFPEEGLNVPKDTASVLNKSFNPAVTEVDRSQADGEPRLYMTFDVSATILLQKPDGTPAFLPVSKTIHYNLLPDGNADIPWRIDGFTGDYRFSPVTDAMPEVVSGS